MATPNRPEKLNAAYVFMCRWVLLSGAKDVAAHVQHSCDACQHDAIVFLLRSWWEMIPQGHPWSHVWVNMFYDYVKGLLETHWPRMAWEVVSGQDVAMHLARLQSIIPLGPVPAPLLLELPSSDDEEAMEGEEEEASHGSDEVVEEVATSNDHLAFLL